MGIFSRSPCPLFILLLRAGGQLSGENPAVPGRFLAGTMGGSEGFPARVAGPADRCGDPVPPPSLASSRGRRLHGGASPPGGPMGARLVGKNLPRADSHVGLWISGRSSLLPVPSGRHPGRDPQPPTASGSVDRSRPAGPDRACEFHGARGVGGKSRMEKLRTHRLRPRADLPRHSSPAGGKKAFRILGKEFSPPHPPLFFWPEPPNPCPRQIPARFLPATNR